MNRNKNGNSSKDLLYSECTGTTVVEHVLDTLEKKCNSRSLREKMDEFFKKKEKSESFERGRKLLSLIEKEQDMPNVSTEYLKDKSNPLQDAENDGGIEVVMEVDENSPESNVDAWFLFNIPKEQGSNFSDDELEKHSPDQRILDLSNSSDTSDDELEQNFPIKANGFALNDSNSSTTSSDEIELNSALSSAVVKNARNFFIDDTSDTSDNESEQNFPIIANGFVLNNNDSSDSSSDESDQNHNNSLKMQNSPNFIDDDSSNSSDVKNDCYLSFSTVKENLFCANKVAPKLPVYLKKVEKIIELSDNESSENLNHEFSKQSSSYSNAENLSSEKKVMSNFLLNKSSNHSLDQCVQNGSFHNGQKSFAEDNCSDSSSVMSDVSGRKKINVLGTDSSKLLGNETAEGFSEADSKKRKLCVVDEISNSFDTKKKVSIHKKSKI